MSAFVRTTLFLLILITSLSTVSAQGSDRGMEAMQLEHWDDAIKIYTEKTQGNPADQDAWMTLGNAYMAKGDLEKAKEATEAAYKANSNNAMALVANGRTALISNDASTADAQFKKAAKSGRKDIDALRAIGESYLYYTSPGAKRPNYTRAEELLKEALATNAKDFKTIMALGYCYKEMPNGGFAATQYEYAATLEKNNPLPKLMLAKTYQAAKLPERSLAYLDQAIATDPAYTPAYRMKAEGFYYERRFEKARATYADMMANCKDYTIEDQMFYANTLYLTKGYEECIKQVEQIIVKDNSKAYLKRLLGYSYYETESYDKGLGIMRDYFNSKPENVLASDYLYMGRLIVKTGGDTLAAIQEWNQAVQKDSSTWPIYKEMGEMLYTMRDYCGAASAYVKYLDSVPTPEATDYYRLGLCQFYCKDDLERYQHAAATFTKLTDMAPTAAIGWEWRAKSEVKLEPDIQTDTTLIPQFGVARNSYEKFVEIASADVAKNRDKLIPAYEYLLYYHFVRGCATPFNQVLGKLLELDPNDETGNGLKTQVETGGMPPTPAGVVCE